MEAEEKTFLTSEQFVKKIKKVYRDSHKSVEADIANFYNKYAKDDGSLSYKEAKKILTPIELQEYKRNIKDRYDIKMSDRVKISRLESLLGQIKAEQDNMFKEQLTLFNEALETVYKDSYYDGVYTVQSGVKMKYEFDRIDHDAIKNILKQDIDGENFSEKIWGKHRPKLFAEVQKSIVTSLVKGTSYKTLAKELSEKYNTSFYNASRLIRTEANYFAGQGCINSYKSAGVDYYVVIATLDGKTSNVCRELDGKVFERKDAVVGVNFNPLHPNCRTTTGAYFPNISKFKNRISRDKNGKSVRGEYQTYSEWEKENGI